MMSLEAAIGIAVAAHAGQKDKLGEPVILHPLRVMGRVVEKYRNTHARCLELAQIAVLHDVLEDTPVTLIELQHRGLSLFAAEGLNAVTRQEGETYKAFIDRVALCHQGRLVKIEDVTDNLQRPGPREFKKSMRSRYARALRVLGADDMDRRLQR